MFSAIKKTVGRDPPPPVGQAGIEHAAEIGPDEEADDRWREHVLDVVAQAGEEAAPWAHRPAREDIGGAGIGKRRTHLRDAEDEAKKHDRHDCCRNHQAAPAGDREPIVLAGKMPGDHGANA